MEVVGLRVAFDDGERPLQQIAANLDAVQLVPALGQSGVERGGIGVVRAVVDPVAVLDDLDGLVRGAELGTVFGKEIHHVASCVFVKKSIARTAEGVKEKLPADRELFLLFGQAFLALRSARRASPLWSRGEMRL